MTTGRLAATFAVIGGSAWALRASYSALVLGRRSHSGYAPTELLDRIDFLIPLCFLAALLLAHRIERRRSLRVAAAGTPFLAAGLFIESWMYGTDIATGLLALPGYFLMGIALVATRTIRWSGVGALMLAQPLGSALLYNLGRDSGAWDAGAAGLAATQWDVTLALLAGVAWVLAALPARARTAAALPT